MNPETMELVFLGTGSMMPSHTRNISALAMSYGANWWLFDCGEGTQHQTLKCRVAPTAISRIFITHLHGDHLFGLPGFLCKMGSASKDEATRVVELVGPVGLRTYVRACMAGSHSNLTFKYVVHELHFEPSKDLPAVSEPSSYHCELPGENLIRDAKGVWVIPSRNVDVPKSDKGEPVLRVFAAEVLHSVRTVGFVIQETDFPGGLNKPAADAIKKRLQSPENVAFFKQPEVAAALKAQGISNPMALLGELKKNKSITLYDGVVEPSACIEPDKKGRKLAILGDTCDGSAIAWLAAGADILVHEATNTYLPEMDGEKGERAVQARTVDHGHSTATMAGRFARDIRARTLIMTHFSQRYKGDESPESLQVMETIVNQARAAFDSPAVYAARDLWSFPVPIVRDEVPPVDPDAVEAAARATATAIRAEVAAELAIIGHEDAEDMCRH